MYILLLSAPVILEQSTYGSIHIWRQMVFGYFWPMYPPNLIRQFTTYFVKSDAAWPTYLPKNLTSYVNAPYYDQHP